MDSGAMPIYFQFGLMHRCPLAHHLELPARQGALQNFDLVDAYLRLTTGGERMEVWNEWSSQYIWMTIP